MSTVDREMLAGPTLGAVDLVAIERARTGQRIELTEAELAYLFDHMDGSNEESRLVGQAIGWAPNSVQRVYFRRRQAAPL